MVYGMVPPEMVVLTEPVAPLKQRTGATTEEIVMSVGCASVTVVFAVQPFASVTVNV